MKNTISDLWNGNISPWSEEPYQKEEIYELAALVDKYKEALYDSLNDEQKRIVKNIDDCMTEQLFLEREDAFLRGFSLGIKLLTEAIDDDK